MHVVRLHALVHPVQVLLALTEDNRLHVDEVLNLMRLVQVRSGYKNLGITILDYIYHHTTHNAHYTSDTLHNANCTVHVHIDVGIPCLRATWPYMAYNHSARPIQVAHDCCCGGC